MDMTNEQRIIAELKQAGVAKDAAIERATQALRVANREIQRLTKLVEANQKLSDQQTEQLRLARRPWFEQICDDSRLALNYCFERINF